MNHATIVQRGLLAFVVVLSAGFAGCADKKEQQSEHYTSPQVAGANSRINLEAVEKAFWTSKGDDFGHWMGAFEGRVNEIYEGTEIVAVDAERKHDWLKVTGFIDKNGQAGYQTSDERLFAIEQTGDAVGKAVPYRVADSHGSTYYEGHHSLLDNPFLQAMLISHMWGSFGGHYYTSPRVITSLRDHRDAYRHSSSYQAQRKSNLSFSSRFKQKARAQGVESTRRFGSSAQKTDATSKRSWSGKSTGSTANSSNKSSAGSSWSGRRSSASSSSKSSSWGGRRSSSSSRRSWGGRRR